MAWAVSIAAFVVSKLAYILLEDIPSVLANFTTIRSFLVQVRMGQVLLFQFVIAVSLIMLSHLVKSRNGFRVMFGLVAVGIVPSSLTGHSGNTSWHELAVGSWAVHIVSVSIWSALVGALLYLAIFTPSDIRLNIGIVSKVSLPCFFIVTASGVVNAGVRMPSLESVFTSTYGKILIAKILVFIIVGVIAGYYRARIIPNDLTTSNIFYRLLMIEVLLMCVAIMLGVVLSETKFPIVRVVPN